MALSAYACEAETAQQLKKGDFKLSHVKTPPTNAVLHEIHDTDTEEVKRIKQLVNELRMKLGNSTDLIKIEPETALFNILYTKDEIDQLMILHGEGFNLPMFLHSVLITGANMIKLRSGAKETTEKYTDLFNVTADNFDYAYSVLTHYAEQIKDLTTNVTELTEDAKALNISVDKLEETVKNIKSCECDHEWQSGMKTAFTPSDTQVNVNTDLVTNGTIKVKAVDVGATLENHETRISAIEETGGGGTGDGYWKKNPARMTRLPEHIALEDFDFDKSASTITYKKISEQYSLVYFPNLVSVDLDYDRYQFITISGLAVNKSNASADLSGFGLEVQDHYITTKDKQIQIPLINSLSFGEVFDHVCDVHDIGILWRNKQPVEKNIGIDIAVNHGGTVSWARFESEVYKGTEEDPATLYFDEYDSADNLVLRTVFSLTHTVTTLAGGGIEYVYPDGKRKYIQCEEISKVGGRATYFMSDFEPGVVKATLGVVQRVFQDVTPDEFITKKLHTNQIKFRYTPDRDILGNNDPPSITSTLLVDNATSIKAPNTMDFHKYGGVNDYEIRLDKLVIDSDSTVGFNKISFMDFEIGGDYEGPVFTLYFGTSRFMMNNEAIMKPISCYHEDTKFYTDKLFKKDGYWTSEKVEVDCACFLWDKLAAATLQDCYNTGEITIKYIPRRSQLSCHHDVICKEVFADNVMSLYKSSTPCFYNPKLITESEYVRQLYTIDFGYDESSDEFKALPEGFRFRLTDPVFNYNYEAIKKDNKWEYTYGNLHYQSSAGKGFAANKFIRGPTVVMNDSNKTVLTIIMQALGKGDVKDIDKMWKTLWDNSTVTISKDTNGKDAFKAKGVGSKDGYCYYEFTYDDTSKAYILNNEYTINISTKAGDQEILNLTFRWYCSQLYDPSTGPDDPHPTSFVTTVDCYELLPVRYVNTLDFEYTVAPDYQKTKGLRFYSTPDFLIWNSEIAYSKGTNTWRFLYDKDYVQIEPRPESCSALMTDKNIITDGIVVAQNLETHLHSLNQVANASEELTQHVAYTDNILAEVIANLQSVNEFIRMTVITDFICLGISGLCSITKMGAAFMKGGAESALRFTERPIIREVIQDGRTYNRIGHDLAEAEIEGARISMRSGGEIFEESVVITRNAEREISETAGTIRREASELSDTASVYNLSAESLTEDISEASSYSSGAYHRSVRESMVLDIGGSATVHSPVVSVTANELHVLGDGSNLPSLAIQSFTEGRDVFMGWCRDIGAGLRNRFGIVLDSRHLINIGQKISDIFWLMIASEKAITWGIQIGTKINNCIKFNLLDTEDKVQADFLFDKFNWHVVDKDGNKSEHIIKGIAKYNEMSGWDDEKLITGQALIENYYDKATIDSMVSGNTSGGSSTAKILEDKGFKVYMDEQLGYIFQAKSYSDGNGAFGYMNFVNPSGQPGPMAGMTFAESVSDYSLAISVRGDEALRMAKNKSNNKTSIAITGDLTVNGKSIYTKDEVDALMQPLLDRIAALEAKLNADELTVNKLKAEEIVVGDVMKLFCTPEKRNRAMLAVWHPHSNVWGSGFTIHRDIYPEGNPDRFVIELGGGKDIKGVPYQAPSAEADYRTIMASSLLIRPGFETEE